jgi:multidrug efflux pump subunit AcrB
MGSVLLFGSGDYAMRVWINPRLLAARNMTAGDVVTAIREQNAQVAAGVVGAPPAPNDTDFQLQVNAQGRLIKEDFADIIIRSDPKTGALVSRTWGGSRSAPTRIRCAACSTTRRRLPSSNRRARTRSSCRTMCAPP